MTITDTSLYQALVGRLKNTAGFFIKSGGKLEGASGGIAELEAGFKFYLEDSNGSIDVEEMRYMLADKLTVQNVGISATSVTADFDVLNLQANAGVVILSMTSNHIATGPSFYMTSCVQGQDVWVHCVQYSGESGMAAIAMSGASLVYLGRAFTSLTLYTSVASAAAVHFRCFADDEWTVIGDNGCAAAMIVVS